MAPTDSPKTLDLNTNQCSGTFLNSEDLNLNAASVEQILWRFHIEGLHIICSGGSNSVTKQTDNCVTGNAADSIYHRSKSKGFNLSNYHWIEQELFKAHHSNLHNSIHSNTFFWSYTLRSTLLPMRCQLMPITNGHISKQ